MQLLVLCEGGVVQQVLLGLGPGGAVRDVGHVVQNVLQSFPVPLSQLLGLLLEALWRRGKQDVNSVSDHKAPLS